MRKISLAPTLVLSGFSFPLNTVAQAESVNRAHVDFQTRYGYDISGDSFTNTEVVGSQW